MKGVVLATSVLVILSLASSAALAGPPRGLPAGEPAEQADAVAGELRAASQRVIDEYGSGLLVMPSEESSDGSSPEAPASESEEEDDGRTHGAPEVDPTPPAPDGQDVAYDTAGLLCGKIQPQGQQSCSADDLPDDPTDSESNQSPGAPEFFVPFMVTDEPTIEAPTVEDVDATRDGLVGVINALLAPVSQAALEASAAARRVVGEGMATADIMVHQATYIAESQIAGAKHQIEGISVHVLDKFWDLVPIEDSTTKTDLGNSDSGPMTTAATTMTPVKSASLAMAAVGGAGLLVAAFAILRRLIGLGSVSLLSRIPSKDIMKNDTRAAIFDIVTHDAGVSLNEIVSRLGISRNAVAYHLAVFESEKTVVSVKDGKYRRYFVNGGKYVNGAKDVVSTIKNDVTLGVIQYIMAHPGSIQKEVCQAVGTSPSATNWHINRLEKVGLVEKEKVANTVRYSPGPSFEKYDLADFGLPSPVPA